MNHQHGSYGKVPEFAKYIEAVPQEFVQAYAPCKGIEFAKFGTGAIRATQGIELAKARGVEFVRASSELGRIAQSIQGLTKASATAQCTKLAKVDSELSGARRNFVELAKEKKPVLELAETRSQILGATRVLEVAKASSVIKNTVQLLDRASMSLAICRGFTKASDMPNPERALARFDIPGIEEVLSMPGLERTLAALAKPIRTEQIFSSPGRRVQVRSVPGHLKVEENRSGETPVTYLNSVDEKALSRIFTAIWSLRAKCNEASRISGGPEIFKPTTRNSLEPVERLQKFCEDKMSFAVLVDDLYFIFYEGAGKDNLRFLQENGGSLDKTDCEFIWCIKYLRNKWLRHDPDHGKEAKIQSDWSKIQVELNWLGLMKSPIDADHFRHLNLRLLQEAEAFLNKLLERMAKG
ncbi:hypothetical protein [Leptolyngbya sp. FACHB-261]|uniref:hypothetical protein n=1 Tax=Leptolyngbya sp. FACHB-261 TaxID=2692806 RepID=UPI001683DE42|nr:hypothetical protein [Leptolyngbya sp. FACHB-261]MBD2103078.1 hypothetical protein [Leptolyngbya sp. FACHB-261]